MDETNILCDAVVAWVSAVLPRSARISSRSLRPCSRDAVTWPLRPGCSRVPSLSWPLVRLMGLWCCTATLSHHCGPAS